MANLRAIRRNLGRSFKKAEKEASERVKVTVQTMVDKLVYTTPVDTSEALSNWTTSIGSVDRSHIDPWVPGQAGSTQRQSATLTSSYTRIVLRSKKPGQSVFMSNSAPHIRDLERGKSKQNAHFVQAAVALGRVTIKRKSNG